MSKTSKAPANATRQSNLPIAVIVWKGGYGNVARLGFTDPLEALLTAITYLRQRYQVRLTDATCDALETMAPELERLLSPDTTIPAARSAARKSAARKGTGDRVRIPAVVFSPPDGLPVALD